MSKGIVPTAAVVANSGAAAVAPAGSANSGAVAAAGVAAGDLTITVVGDDGDAAAL